MTGKNAIVRKLNPRQLVFVQAYLKNANATEAAMIAGYSKKTARVIGSENLLKPAIASALAAGRKKTAVRLEITLDEVVGNARELIKRGLTPEPVMARLNGVMTKTGEYKYDSAAVAKGNEQLIKMGGLFAPERHEHKHGLTDRTDDEMRNRLLEIREKKALSEQCS